MTQPTSEPDAPATEPEPDDRHESAAQAGPTQEPEGLAPLGGPAEAEPPQHAVDPDDATDTSVEDSVAYELAVEDGAPLPATGPDPGAGDLAPEFTEPTP